MEKKRRQHGLSESGQGQRSAREPVSNLLISALYSSSGFFQHRSGHPVFRRADPKRQSLKTYFPVPGLELGSRHNCLWLVPTFGSTYTANSRNRACPWARMQSHRGSAVSIQRPSLLERHVRGTANRKRFNVFTAFGTVASWLLSGDTEAELTNGDVS